MHDITWIFPPTAVKTSVSTKEKISCGPFRFVLFFILCHSCSWRNCAYFVCSTLVELLAYLLVYFRSQMSFRIWRRSTRIGRVLYTRIWVRTLVLYFAFTMGMANGETWSGKELGSMWWRPHWCSHVGIYTVWNFHEFSNPEIVVTVLECLTVLQCSAYRVDQELGGDTMSHLGFRPIHLQIGIRICGQLMPRTHKQRCDLCFALFLFF